MRITRLCSGILYGSFGPPLERGKPTSTAFPVSCIEIQTNNAYVNVIHLMETKMKGIGGKKADSLVNDEPRSLSRLLLQHGRL